MTATQRTNAKKSPENQTRYYKVERRFSGERYTKDVVKRLFLAHDFTT